MTDIKVSFDLIIPIAIPVAICFSSSDVHRNFWFSSGSRLPFHNWTWSENMKSVQYMYTGAYLLKRWVMFLPIWNFSLQVTI